MRIAPLLSNFIKPFGIYKNNQNEYSSYNTTVKTFGLKQDIFVKEPSFTSIKGGTDFKNLVDTKKLHCIYCGRPLLSAKVLNKLKTNGVFSDSIKNFVQQMLNYTEYLHPAEKEFVKKTAILAFDYPNIRLSETIKKLFPQAYKELLNEQKPVFKELATLVNEMPRGYKTKFKELLKISKYKIEEKEYIPQKFSGKEFRYKMSRIEDTLKDEYMAKKINKLSEPLIHPIMRKEKEPLTQKFINDILFLTETRDINSINWTKKDLELLIINKIKQYGEILNRKDILYLCDSAQKTIERKPVKVKFSNKSFKYDLNTILEGMPDIQLRQKIDSIVSKLPNSLTSVNAFIIKHELAASDAIGYDLLRPSVATIEHMVPRSLGGASKLNNYALACSRDNNMRSDTDLKEFIKKFDKKNQIKYFADIFEEVYNWNISMDTAEEMLETFMYESGRQISLPKTYSKTAPRKQNNKIINKCKKRRK